MTVTDLPVLVFVPGAWHTTECFEPTTIRLHELGYQCVCVSLPTVGSELRNEPPPQSWDPDVAAIRKPILDAITLGSDVVLICHSYGGMVGSEACKGLGKSERESQGLTGGVVKLVYLQALVMDIGHYVWEMSGGKPYDSERTVLDGDLSYVKHTDTWFYNRCAPDQQERLSKRLQSHAWKAFLSPVTYTAWRDIPGIYLMAENDQAIPMDFQKAMLDAAEGHQFEIEQCDSDHSSFMSRPAAAVQVIRRAAGEDVDQLQPDH